MPIHQLQQRITKNLPAILGSIVIAVLIYSPVFGHLDTLPIRLWDESRLAINAYEMHKDGNWIVTHYDGKPDMWNTKPPFMIWSQVFFMKLIGPGELALRLPSAIAAFLLCALLIAFSVRYLKNFWFGFMAVMVLITSQGFISEHGSRTGDYDALVSLFMATSCLSLFLYTETSKTKYLYFMFIGLTLAGLTKGIVAMLFIPGLFIYLLATKQLFKTLKNKHLYFGAAIFLIVVAGYYVLREIQNPGYIEAVRQNELGGRYLVVKEGNTGGFWHYYNQLVIKRFAEWILLIPCGLAIGLVHKEQKFVRLTTFSAILTISYFLIISLSKTKLDWYDMPMYPFLAIMAAIFMHFIFSLLKETPFVHNLLRVKILPYLFLFLLCIAPYRKIIDKTYKPKDKDNKEFYQVGYFLQDAMRGHYNLNSYGFLSGNSPQNWFYVHLLQDKGINFDYKDHTKLEPNEKVIAHQDNVKEYLQAHYETEVLGTNEQICFYKIISKKDHTTMTGTLHEK